MIDLDGKPYRLLLLDTNFLTRLFDRPDARVSRFMSSVDVGNTVFAISAFTLLEVRDRHASFQKLLKLFTWFPVVVLKTVHQLIQEEIRVYPDPKGVDPIMLAPVGIRPAPGQSKDEAIRAVFQDPTNVRLMDDLRRDRGEILDSLLSLRPNFPRPPGGYTADNIRDFAAKVCFQQAAAADLEWVERMGGARFELNSAAFPSVKASAYSVFFRFYVDGDRRPKRSDVFDVATAAALPYVEAAALEKNQAHILRQQLPAIDPFLSGLELWTFRDLVGG